MTKSAICRICRTPTSRLKQHRMVRVLFLFCFGLYRFQTGFDYEIPDDDDRLRELLIHEICHIKAQGHGKKWANNMKKAQWDAFINPSVSKALEGLIDYDVMKLFDERLT